MGSLGVGEFGDFEKCGDLGGWLTWELVEFWNSGNFDSLGIGKLGSLEVVKSGRWGGG